MEHHSYRRADPSSCRLALENGCPGGRGPVGTSLRFVMAASHGPNKVLKGAWSGDQVDPLTAAIWRSMGCKMGDQVVNYCEHLGFPLFHISGCFHFAKLSPLFSCGPTTSCPIPTSFWPFSTVETFPFWPKTVCAHAKKNSQGVFNRRAGQKKRECIGI
jgi:hypothetical protein